MLSDVKLIYLTWEDLQQKVYCISHHTYFVRSYSTLLHEQSLTNVHSFP